MHYPLQISKPNQPKPPNKLTMEWKNYYLDVILIPLGLLLTFTYHAWLWYKVKTRPLATIIGVNAAVRRPWIAAMLAVFSFFTISKSCHHHLFGRRLVELLLLYPI